jgi:predicted PurR-regulated permease PerM
MALSSRTKIFLGLGFGVTLICVFFWMCGAILAPFILGAAMAYGYRPVSRFFRKKSISSSISALVLAIITYGAFAYSVAKTVPLLGTWSSLLSVKFNVYREAFWNFLTPLINDFFKDSGSQIQEGMDFILRQGVQWLGSLAMYALHNGWALGQIILTLALSPVIAFYLTKDGAKIHRQLRTLIPPQYRGVIGLIFRDMDRALRQYFSGQVRVCALLATYYALFLGGFLNLPGALTMSLVSGSLVFIPYIGFFISLFAACMIGVVESGQWPYVTSIALVYLGGNILESLVLTPYLVGSRTGLHPLWVLLSVLIGGGVKGIVGIVLALPVATIGGACWRLLRKWYVHSALYGQGFSKTIQSKDPL